MPIDPQAKAIGEQLGAGLDFTRLDLAAVRAASDAGARLGPRPEVAQLEERAPTDAVPSRAKEALDDAIRELRAQL
jgi:hypothetical protein